jgi:alkanesulfonate monooxygenase SsuD/methylene tetrahydromethanopterin reductase-like flavin-dependent oxidoreductase (luciferase family)
MRSGLFGGTVVPRGDPSSMSAQKRADYIEANVEAERLGYYATFLTEHHFTGVGQISAPRTRYRQGIPRLRVLRICHADGGGRWTLR